MNSQVMIELKPCPFCGSKKVKSKSDDGQYWGQCQGCFAEGPPTSKRSDESDPDWNTRATPAPIPDAGEGVEYLPDSKFQDEFQVWWEEEGQYVRSGGGAYERTFAFQAWRHLMPKLVSALQASSGIPDGWKLVPVEPTEEMLASVTTSKHEMLRAEVMRMAADDYRKMLAAAPATGGDV